MHRSWIRIGGWLAVIIVVAIVAGFFIDEPLRVYLEREINHHVRGYQVKIEKLDFHPIGFSLDLENVTVRQTSHPEPPIAAISRWHASLEWTALLFGRFVNNHRLERPVLHVTRIQAKQEAEDETPVAKRGWQDAVEAVYPFKINEIQIVDGTLTYLDEAKPARPVRVDHLNATASNIRNVRSRNQEYPSEFHVEGILLDSGTLLVDGHADFLAEPHAGVKGEFHIGETPLAALLPVTGRYNVQLRDGKLSADGLVEYAPRKKDVHVTNLVLDGVRVDYVHAAQTTASEESRAKEAVHTAKQLNRDSELSVRLDRLRLVDCEVGFVNAAADPPYRIFLTQTDLMVENLSSHLKEGAADLTMTGKFMGTGDTMVSGVFRPEQTSPDFNLSVEIRQTQLKSMNDLLRAYADLDVVRGLFSFYAELTIKNGTIEGYLKPLFKNVKVYDERQDRDKGFFHRIYEGLAGDLAAFLENPKRDEVATRTGVSGRLDSPETDTVEAVLRLVQNAFFKAILPGLDRELERPGPHS